MKYLFAALAALSAIAAQASCLNYGPASLTGRVVRQTYAGPPDYESTTRGDRAVVYYVLQLDYTLCVADSSVVGRGIRELQLEWSGGDPATLLGRKVTVTGELIRGGARHDKKDVIVAREIVE
jgi:hypothetical protein